MNSRNNAPKLDQQSPDADSKALEHLEEMWDRHILKGDDDFLEARDSSTSKQAKGTPQEKQDPLEQKRRRGRRM